jgi:small subunit ribosomal protein S1
MSWTKKNVHPNKIVSTSQEVDVQVLDIDMEKRRISLGIKQTQDNPWATFGQAHHVDQIIEGEIRNITEFGLFVGMSGDIDGMVHLSDVSWEDSSEEALKAYKKGDIVKVKILDIDADKERVALGIKQLSEDTSASALAGIAKGQVVTGTVISVNDNGIEVQVNDTVKGTIKRADLSRERSEQRPDRFAVGEKVDAKVVGIDSKKKIVTLSIKQRELDEDKAAMAEFGSADSGASLGDILGAALKGSAPAEDKPKKKAAKKDTAEE